MNQKVLKVPSPLNELFCPKISKEWNESPTLESTMEIEWEESINEPE